MLDDIKVADVKRFESGLLNFMEEKHKDIMDTIDKEKKISDETEQPLSGYLIEVIDPEAEPEDQHFGILTIDARGILVINFTLPVDAPEDTVRRLQLNISEGGAVVAEI